MLDAGAVFSRVELELLGRLSEAAGVPGREERVREIVRGEIEGLVDEVREDALGNLIALKRGSGGRRVMLSAHLDEIGFVVRQIDDRGLLRVQPLGGFDPRTLFMRDVRVLARGGDLPGALVPAGRPFFIAEGDEKKKVPEARAFVVDLGLAPERARELVRPGDPIVLEQRFRRLGPLACGKAMDDRASVFVLIETLRRLAGRQLAPDLVAVFSVQEEVGVRGATVAAYGIEPEVGIALDVTPSFDSAGVPPEDVVARLGAGVAVKVLDQNMISTRWVLDELIAAAEAGGIPYQLEVLPLGGTDGGPIQRSRAGVPTAAVSIPVRYLHSVQECVHEADLQAAVDLLDAWLTRA